MKSIETHPQINKLVLNRLYEDKFKLPYGILFEGDFNNFYHELIKKLSEINPKMIITVGDYVTYSFLNKGISINVAIIDFKIKRESFQYDPTTFFKRKFIIDNPPGTINASSWLTIQYTLSLEDTSLIIVNGEEDLLALPCILCAPLNSVVFFGIPNIGLMLVPVDSKARDYAFNLLKFFIPVSTQ
ncbi:MAG: GTP-dependent dephospho-CoA kinase family protein [Candidatus Methanomethylicia archaeon]